MKKFLFLAILIMLQACTTPTTMLKHPKTGQFASCGGNTSSSIMGGALGYHLQKESDEKCVLQHEKQGFQKVD